MPKRKPTEVVTAYMKWYNNNREAFNRRRAEKYALNEDLRRKTVLKQRLYRETKPREVAKGQFFRLIGGRHLEVFRIGKVAEMIGRDEQTIRLWEFNGYIPSPVVKSIHRFYTLNQVGLMREFGELSTSLRWQRKAREVAIPIKVEEIKARWAGV